jgi:protein O-mannosyl-transferase
MKITICIFLALSTFSVYFQVQDHEFLNYDDDIYITENVNLKSGLTAKSIKNVFSKLEFGAWLPITSLSYLLDYQLYGLNPRGYLLTNLFFHIVNSLLLFIIFLRMTGAIWQSAFVAVMFALHPLNVESVAWVAERKNVLSTFFWLLTIWTYIRYAEKSTISRYSLVFLFFALGLMSKPMLVTLPFVLLLFDYWPLGRFKLGQREREFKIVQKDKYVDCEKNASKLVLEKLPLLILSALFSITNLIHLEKNDGVPAAQDPVPILTILTNVMISYFEYLWKMLWPKGLAILYAHPENTLAVWKGVLCGIALLVITTISIKLIRKAPYFVIGWFWYLGTLIPVIGFITIGPHLIADRYTYLPLIGIFVIIAWGVPDLLKKWHYKKNVLKVSAGILILTLMLITWIQVSHWKSSITVFTHAVKVTDKKYPNFAIAHNNLGSALFNNHSTPKNVEEAISHYKKAIKLKPDYPEAHSNLGAVAFYQNRFDEAISHYKKAIKLNPDYAEAYNSLGLVFLSVGEMVEAVSHYKKAIKLNPDYAEAHSNLGDMMFAEGKNKIAISLYRTAIKLKPDFYEAHNNLGNALFTLEKTKEAIFHYRASIKLMPHAQAYSNLADALFAQGKRDEGISHYKTAIKLMPTNIPAHNNLGNALVTQGKYEAAIPYFEAAIKLNPNFFLGHNNLGKALSFLGKKDEAITHYKAAIKLKPAYTEAHNNLKKVLNQLKE